MKYLLGLLATTLNISAFAGSDFNCSGKIVEVLAEHPGCGESEEFVAFKTSVTGNKWICTTSNSGTTIVLAAAMAKSTVGAVLDTDSGSTSCGNIVNFSPLEYIVLYPKN